MPSITPGPRTWTLRFKTNRTTILLHVDPLQTLSSVKSELLKAVQQTNPNGRLNGYEIPQNADEIQLARPADINDLSLGWENLEPRNEFPDGEEPESGKGKGKAGASSKSAGKASSKLKDCPQGAGLRDGGVVAFKFRRPEDEEDERAKEDEDGDEGIVVESERPEEWDVVVPTMEETYADQVPVED